MKFLLALLAAASLLHAQDDMEDHRRCARCNMDRKAYGYSRMLLRFEDGGVIGVCSPHCARAVLESDPARKIKTVEAADRNTRVLVDAEKAFWVMGGDKPGVMSRVAKWAFAGKTDAEKFVNGHGGRLVSFKEALLAREENVREEAYPALSKPGQKIPIGKNHYFTYGFTSPPRLGAVIMKVEVFTSEGRRDTTFRVAGDTDMPSMRGAHSTGNRGFSVSAKGFYLLPVQLVMPGDWEMRFVFEKDGKTALRGAYLFDL